MATGLFLDVAESDCKPLRLASTQAVVGVQNTPIQIYPELDLFQVAAVLNQKLSNNVSETYAFYSE